MYADTTATLRSLIGDANIGMNLADCGGGSSCGAEAAAAAGQAAVVVVTVHAARVIVADMIRAIVAGMAIMHRAHRNRHRRLHLGLQRRLFQTPHTFQLVAVRQVTAVQPTASPHMTGAIAADVRRTQVAQAPNAAVHQNVLLRRRHFPSHPRLSPTNELAKEQAASAWYASVSPGILCCGIPPERG